MRLEEIKDTWIAKYSDAKAEIQMWDAQADRYKSKALPTIENNHFLKLLNDNGMLQKDFDTLDIGCGAGSLSLAIAPMVHSVTGVDFAPGMIAAASDLAKAYPNASFEVLGWSDCDIKASGYEKRFDLVFAHMTAAINDFDTFQKLIAASRRYCVLCKPTRRHDTVMSVLERLVGLEEVKGHDDDFVYAFATLWEMGYNVKCDYEKQVMQRSRSLDEAIKYYDSRLRLVKDVTTEDQEKVAAKLKELAEDGMVNEELHTTKATLYWEV